MGESYLPTSLTRVRGPNSITIPTCDYAHVFRQENSLHAAGSSAPATRNLLAEPLRFRLVQAPSSFVAGSLVKCRCPTFTCMGRWVGCFTTLGKEATSWAALLVPFPIFLCPTFDNCRHTLLWKVFLSLRSGQPQPQGRCNPLSRFHAARHKALPPEESFPEAWNPATRAARAKMKCGGGSRECGASFTQSSSPRAAGLSNHAAIMSDWIDCPTGSLQPCCHAAMLDILASTCHDAGVIVLLWLLQWTS